MKVRDLAPSEAITLQCSTCQSTITWSRCVNDPFTAHSTWPWEDTA
jgi:hypothetical protein